MPNRLREATSPYLRQHADNPVDWHAWGPEALERARREHRPILLSIGYAACHWCHVMAHESFEDPATADLMNELFVNIKVDREERPDLDAVYMQAVQALTGHGGWPLTVFLTPEAIPFHGGTYFPPVDRQGMPSFQRVLRAVSNAWRDKPSQVEAAGVALAEHIRKAAAPPDAGNLPDRTTLDLAFRGLARSFDERTGGFGGAPKFPPSMVLDFLLCYWVRTGETLALEMVRKTCSAIFRGGLFDQLGGGIHRYAVDSDWLVPHFEKMLYDNALLARLSVRLWQATRDSNARDAAERTLDWAIREMRDPGGGFFSSLDADSEGHEGLFYTWTREELVSAVGPDSTVAEAHWGVTAEGNFEGRNILHVPHGIGATAARTGVTEAEAAESIARARESLYRVRSARTWPARDDKIIASWNGLMIRALCEAARAFQRTDYLEAAQGAGEFLADRLTRQGRVSRSVLGEQVSGPGVLEDYAAVALAFLDLHAASFERHWLELSRDVTEAGIRLFRDPGSGAWYDTATDHETLLVRPRDATDNATPSGTSLMAELLLKWSDLDDIPPWRAMSEQAVSQLGDSLARYPHALGHAATVADTIVNGSTQVALVGEPSDPRFRRLAACVGECLVPGLVLAGGPPTEHPSLLRGRDTGAPTAWVCRGFVCDLPTSVSGELERQLLRQAGNPGPGQPSGTGPQEP